MLSFQGFTVLLVLSMSGTYTTPMAKPLDTVNINLNIDQNELTKGSDYEEEVFVDQIQFDACSEPFADIGHCLAKMPRWSFNPETRRCEKFIYGGCNGNANRFEKYEQCTNICVFNIGKECSSDEDCNEACYTGRSPPV